MVLFPIIYFRMTGEWKIEIISNVFAIEVIKKSTILFSLFSLFFECLQILIFWILFAILKQNNIIFVVYIITSVLFILLLCMNSCYSVRNQFKDDSKFLLEAGTHIFSGTNHEIIERNNIDALISLYLDGWKMSKDMLNNKSLVFAYHYTKPVSILLFLIKNEIIDINQYVSNGGSIYLEENAHDFSANELKLILEIAKEMNIVEVNMCMCKLKNNHCIEIGKALEKNTSLEVLNLDGNYIGSEGGITIGQGLEKNTSLKKLILYQNYIGDEGAIAIGNALEKNISLQELNLGCNSIGDEGAIAIGNSLEKNTSLEDLSFRQNSIGNEGAIAIGKTLEKNTSLEVLNLRYNSIGDEGCNCN